MNLELRQHAQTFVTRERARELIAALGDPTSPEVTVDAGAVSMSPSFAAELLVGLAAHFSRVIVVSASPSGAHLVSSLANKLGLADRIVLGETTLA